MKTDYFLIIGINNGGLFLARQLRRQTPQCTIYAIGLPNDIGKYSNVIDHFYTVRDINEIPETLKIIYNKTVGVKVHAIMCSNPILEYIVNCRSDIFELFIFDNSFDIYHQLVDKDEVKRMCERLHIPIPRAYSLKADKLNSVSFPVVVKPLEKNSTLGASKCFFVEDIEQLIDYLYRLKNINIPSDRLVCQQYISGDNRWEYGYGGYFKNGEPLVDAFFYQFIQVPQGLCCYTREILDKTLQKNILSIVQPILKETKYCGVIEFDLKQDENSKEMYLLDINPRPWRSVDMLAGKISRGTIFNPMKLERNVVWRYPMREIINRNNPMNTPYKMCKSISKGGKPRVIIATYDKTDIKPFLIQFLYEIKRCIVMCLKRFA